MKNGVREVAKLAKVSIGTVSNVMNRPEMVAEETVTRVHHAMEQLGYQAGTRKKGRRLLAFGESAQGRELISKVSASGVEVAEIDLSDDSKRQKFFDFLMQNKSAAAALLIVTQAGAMASEFADFISQTNIG